MPHALHISPDSHVSGYDRSRPQPIESPWIEVTAEQFAQAKSMAYPRWVGGGLVDDPPPALTLPEAQAARSEDLAAECDARLAERWPTTDMLAALASVPTTPPAGLAEDVAAHLAARDAALALVAAAKDVAAVNGVTATWPA